MKKPTRSSSVGERSAADARGASMILYAVELEELRRWIGCRDERRFAEAWTVVRDDEEADWEPEELHVLERLLRRMIFEGRLYDGLQPDERYYLTQLLIDLFDEFVDQENLTEELPLDRLTAALQAQRLGPAAKALVDKLTHGREFGGEGALWAGGSVRDMLPYFGYLTAEEAGRLVEALDTAQPRVPPSRDGESGLIRQLHGAAAEAARSEMDLLGFVGPAGG